MKKFVVSSIIMNARLFFFYDTGAGTPTVHRRETATQSRHSIFNTVGARDDEMQCYAPGRQTQCQLRSPSEVGRGTYHSVQCFKGTVKNLTILKDPFLQFKKESIVFLLISQSIQLRYSQQEDFNR